jgi:predicted transcriptional regulator
MGERKIFSTRIDEDLIKKLKHLAVDADKSLGNLLEEAIRELVKKYEKKSKSNT